MFGGTGLYIDSLIYEIEYPNIEFDEEYRKSLEKQVEMEGLKKLYEKAKEIDPQAVEKISENDKKRILRFWKYIMQQGKIKLNKKSNLEKRNRV